MPHRLGFPKTQLGLKREQNGRRRLLLVAAILGVFSAAPTPGDVGGCQPARELDEQAFFSAKYDVDCERCAECNIVSPACEESCAREGRGEAFPEGCLPLTHDGAVCLRALAEASCGDYRDFMGENASLPTECEFCPARQEAP